MKEFFRRIQYRLNRRRWDEDLATDMEFHRDMLARAGHNNFGSVLRLSEQAREAWGWTWIDRLGQDLRYGFRTIGRSPGFTLLAMFVLAIGIGVNVSAFDLFNMMALKPLPVRDPTTLVRLERRSPNAYTSEMAYPSFVFYRDHARTLTAAMAVLGVPPMQINDDVERTSASFVTANYFSQLGTVAAYGRMLDPAIDESRTAPPVVVISYGLWQRRFAADPAIIGRIIRLNKKPVAVAGVAPYEIATLGGQHPDIWLPIAQQPYFVDGSHVLTDFNDSSVRMWGRLGPGVTAKAAEHELRLLTNELRRQHPTAVWDNEFIQSSPGGHLQVMQPEMYQVAMMVGILVLLILAVACGNLGALLLGRAVQREREIGIRLAIGANAARIFRQLCTESLLLAGFGALAGLTLSYVVLRITLNQTDAPKWLTALPDWRVVLFTAGLTFGSVIFFGLTPALQIARQRQHKTIARQILVTAQLAASCVLLIVSALLVRATHRALYTNPGFGYEQLISIDSQLAQHGYNAATAKAYLEHFQARLLAMPNVRSVSLVMLPPLGHAVSREGREINGHSVMLYPNWVTPGFFQTMQIPVLLGRTFYPGEKNAVIVSQSFARRQWGGQSPLGNLIGDGKTKDTVVGVVGDAHVNALSDDDAMEQYWAATNDQMPGLVVMVRIAGTSESFPMAAKSISEGLDPKLFPEIRRIKTLYRENVLIIERIAGIVTLIGLIAVALAGIGVIGIVSFTVLQKTKEIAIRVAVGAGRGEVLATILGQFIWPVLVGLTMGTAFAIATSQILRRALYGVSNLDPIGYAGAIAALLTILSIAALLPARRALRINIARALHYE
ncbi:MAG TPA: ABC transporter permease [Bryobacteraceae bacterium]|nr:ABC transporter permease [Bryobacteraceae bacterium]